MTETNARPQLTTEQLESLAAMPSTIKCGCPKHLAALLLALNAFEDYSAQCESKDDKDRQMHSLLYRETARARSLVQGALDVILQHEGVSLPE